MCRLFRQPQDKRQPMDGTKSWCSMKHCTSKRFSTRWSIRTNADTLGQRYKTIPTMLTKKWILAAHNQRLLHASNRKVKLSFSKHGTLPRRIWRPNHTSRWRHVTTGIPTKFSSRKLNMVCKRRQKVEICRPPQYDFQEETHQKLGTT